jgi:hypothetical protein
MADQPFHDRDANMAELEKIYDVLRLAADAQQVSDRKDIPSRDKVARLISAFVEARRKDDVTTLMGNLGPAGEKSYLQVVTENPRLMVYRQRSVG